MTLIPTPEKQLVTDAAVNCLAGGALNGFGIGTLLSQGGSSGGTDIVGLLGVKRRPEFSVGRISMFINICICIYAAITRDFEVAIYSACYSMLSGFVVDRAHRQNVRQTVYFVSEKPKIGKYINRAMGRGVTSWEVVGEYSGGCSWRRSTRKRLSGSRILRAFTEISDRSSACEPVREPRALA